MNLVFHTIFGILATVFFIWRYTQTKYTYQLILFIWVPSTFLTYLSSNGTYRLVLTIAEAALFLAFIIFFIKSRSRRRAHQDYCDKLRKQIEETDVSSSSINSETGEL